MSSIASLSQAALSAALLATAALAVAQPASAPGTLLVCATAVGREIRSNVEHFNPASIEPASVGPVGTK